MRLRSTRGECPPASFREAVLRGLAPDGGLYVPEAIPGLPDGFWKKLPQLTLPEIGLEVCKGMLADEIPAEPLRSLLEDAFDFDVPLTRVNDSDHVLELFHGPTFAFKDFGARFLARTLRWFHRGADEPLTVLVATSGDTGSAVAHGFFGVEGIRVVVLYPSGKVSRLQEQQLTTMGGNVTAVEVAGTFDDCQRLVKRAFADEALRARTPLTSANSISIGRLLPQSFYYLRAYGRLEAMATAGTTGEPVVFSVPSGNFGNLTAGLIAWRMGLPVARFIAATNVNDVVPEYLETAKYRPRPSVATLSSAMDVGDPSNFVRTRDLFGDDWEAMRRMLFGARFTDAETVDAIRDVHARYGYVFEPHGAVAWLGLQSWRRRQGRVLRGVALATAHPAKFHEAVERAIGAPVEIPERLRRVLDREKHAVPMGTAYEELRALLEAG